MTDGETTDHGERPEAPDERTDATGGAGDPGPVRDGDPEPVQDDDPEPVRDGGETARDPARGTGSDDAVRKARRGLLWVSLAVLSVLALVALLQFYLNASAAIDRWVAAEYRRIMQAAFNLVVLLCSGIGIALVVRRLGSDGGARWES